MKKSIWMIWKIFFHIFKNQSRSIVIVRLKLNKSGPNFPIYSVIAWFIWKLVVKIIIQNITLCSWSLWDLDHKNKVSNCRNIMVNDTYWIYIGRPATAHIHRWYPAPVRRRPTPCAAIFDAIWTTGPHPRSKLPVVRPWLGREAK